MKMKKARKRSKRSGRSATKAQTSAPTPDLVGFLKAQDRATLKLAAFELLRIEAHGFASPITCHILREVRNMVEDVRVPKKKETRGRPKK